LAGSSVDPSDIGEEVHQMRHPRRALVGAILATLLAAVPAGASASPSADAALRALDREIPFSGIAYGVDASGHVLVTVDSTVTGARLASVRGLAHRFGSVVRVTRVAGVFRTDAVVGGDAIYGRRYRCSLGFNVRSGSAGSYRYAFLTAGHCGKAEGSWWTTSRRTTYLGDTANFSFPGDDYALVWYDAGYTPDAKGQAGSIDVAFAREAAFGETVYRDGSTTGEHSGVVEALNVTVRYQSGGTVRGLIQTTVCAEPGDSGGAMYSKSDKAAIGLTSGGSGDCRSGGTTFFQPVTEALATYGVEVY
jgi:hypothetical protein